MKRFFEVLVFVLNEVIGVVLFLLIVWFITNIFSKGH